MKQEPQCAHCTPHMLCRYEDGKCTAGCPTVTRKDISEAATREYFESPTKEIYLGSLRQLKRNGDKHVVEKKTRLQEIIEFCKDMGYTKLGVAFCISLRDYAVQLTEILEQEGFEVVSVMCKTGAKTKEELGADKNDKMNSDNREISCNPIMQAQLMNEAHTDFNILVGLCLGHDSIFLKESDAYCTVFAVKDRALNNDPLEALRRLKND